MSDPFQTIHRTSDPIEAEILADLLGQHGIDARVLGTRHGALIGVAQHILQLRIEVPGDQVEAACELVDAYLADTRRDAEVDDAEESSTPVSPARLRPILAAGIVMIVPGGGHFYARRPAAAMVVILGYLGALSTLLTAADRDLAVAAAMLAGGMALFDLVGAQAAVRAFNRGVRASVKEQLAVALSVLLAVAVGSRVIAPLVPEVEDPREVPVDFPAPIPLFEGARP